jgi:hypothetical protein
MLAEAAGTADIPGTVAAVIEGALSKDPREATADDAGARSAGEQQGLS